MGKHIWTSIYLIDIGRIAWHQQKYGHSLLLIIGCQLNLKIGTLLNIKWSHLIEGKYNDYVEELEIEGDIREINENLGSFIRIAYEKINPNKESFVFKNYRTGKPFTTASLNRDLRALTENFQDMWRKDFANTYQTHKGKTTSYLEFPYVKIMLEADPIKTKDIHFGWARDEVTARGLTHQAYLEVSQILRHKNTQYTIDYLGLGIVEEKKLTYDYHLNNEDLSKLQDEIETGKTEKEKLLELFNKNKTP